MGTYALPLPYSFIAAPPFHTAEIPAVVNVCTQTAVGLTTRLMAHQFLTKR